jgi:hypothetical protein
MRRALAAFGATLTLAATASAHDYWADGASHARRWKTYSPRESLAERLA